MPHIIMFVSIFLLTLLSFERYSMMTNNYITKMARKYRQKNRYRYGAIAFTHPIIIWHNLPIFATDFGLETLPEVSLSRIGLNKFELICQNSTNPLIKFLLKDLGPKARKHNLMSDIPFNLQIYYYSRMVYFSCHILIGCKMDYGSSYCSSNI